MKVAGD